MNLGKLLLATVLTTGLIGLAGCGDDTPSVASTPVASASTSPAASATPEPDTSTARGTVRAWVEARNELYETGDGGELRALSLQCDYCRGQVNLIEKIYSAGGDVRTTGWKIRKIRQAPGFDSTRTRSALLVRADTGDNTFQRADGAKTQHEEGTLNHPWFFEVRRVEGAWKVTVVGTLDLKSRQ